MKPSFRKAKRSEAKPLIGLYAESGGGKTKSALLLAKGFAQDMSLVGMIETEAGRGEAWAEDPEVGGYQVLPIRGDFSPKNYGEAITAAEEVGLRALIIDSASHEWEGAGGVLSMAAENQAKFKKGPLVWQQPKMQHQREFMLRLMQTPIPLVIVCMRAKYPMYQITATHVAAWKARGENGKPPEVNDWARSTELEPKQAEDILYEMFVHGWLDKETHSFHGTKYTLEELRDVIKDGEPIGIDTGKRLAAWASSAAPGPQQDAGGDYITTDQHTVIMDALKGIRDGEARLKKMAKVDRLTQIPRNAYQRAIDWCETAKAQG